MRKSWAVAATAALIAIAGTISAPSASAAGGTVNGCSGNAMVYLVPVGAPVRVDTSGCSYVRSESDPGSSITVSDAPVSFIDVTLGDASHYVDIITSGTYAMPTPPSPRVSTVDIILYTCADPTFAAWYTGPDGYWDPIFAAAVNHCDWVVPGGDAAASSTPSWSQAYGRQSDGEACESGWTASWAEWPNNGVGGPVCEREIYWDTANASWSTR